MGNLYPPAPPPLNGHKNGHRKHSFSKTLSREEILEAARFLFMCGGMETEVFKYNYIIHQKCIIKIHHNMTDAQ